MTPILTKAGLRLRAVFDPYPFILPPRAPTELEVEFNECSNFIWPGHNSEKLRSNGKESIHVNVDHIAEGTLLPFGGHLCTHWEYLAANEADPSSVSTWVRVEDHDRDDGRPLWYILESLDPVVFPLHSYVGEVCGRRAGDRNLEIVWSVFSPEKEYRSSARFMYRTTRRLNRRTRLWDPPVRGFFADHMWSKKANAEAAAIKAAFLRGEQCPHDEMDVHRYCLGNPGRDTRLYGAYRKTVVASHSATALPDSCIVG